MKETLKKNLTWILIAIIVSISFVASSSLIMMGVAKLKSNNVITVTGSAKKQIKSDYVIWKGTFSTESTQISEAYNGLKQNADQVKSYLKSKGINEKDIVLSSIVTGKNYMVLPGGQITSKVESYRLFQTVEVKSSDVDKITSISREATELINTGVQFESLVPEYYYTKLADLKIDMLNLATKDAKIRAEQIAQSTGNKVGSLRSAKMGVFQITTPFSTNIADYGVNDTSSIDKEITAVVTCDFQVK